MNNVLEKIITDRKKWLSESSIQDWVDADTIYVAEKYANYKNKLHKAAPELLEACIVVVEGYEGDGMENMERRDEVSYEYCKAAIKKATE